MHVFPDSTATDVQYARELLTGMKRAISKRADDVVSGLRHSVLEPAIRQRSRRSSMTRSKRCSVPDKSRLILLRWV